MEHYFIYLSGPKPSNLGSYFEEIWISPSNYKSCIGPASLQGNKDIQCTRTALYYGPRSYIACPKPDSGFQTWLAHVRTWLAYVLYLHQLILRTPSQLQMSQSLLVLPTFETKYYTILKQSLLRFNVRN